MKKDKNLPKNGFDSPILYSSTIGPTLRWNGEISGNEDLVIQGRFKGKIKLAGRSLLIEQGAEVEAEVQVQDITIKGMLQGNVFASGKVLIEKEGQMTGDISAARISIIDGAQFKGSVRMKS